MDVRSSAGKSASLIACFAIALGTLGFLGVTPVHAAAITSMSVTGTGITSNSAALNTALTPTFNFTTTTNLTLTGQVIRIVLAGMSVASGETLAATDITLTGCSTGNTLEDAPGTGDNNAHAVTITNGSSGDDNPEILIELDSDTGTPPTCSAGAMTVAVASSQLVAHDTTAGNYAVHITTSLDNGSFLFYVADENDVLIEADVDNILTFVIRNSADTSDQANVNGGAIGPNLCDLGNLSTAGVQTCSYRLKVSTNASLGYFVSVSVDDDLNNPGDTAFIANQATSSAVTSGTEGYGVLITAGAATVGSITECDGTALVGTSCLADGIDWSDSTNTIFSNTSASVIYDVDGPNNPGTTDTTNTALITHSAEADAGTAAGTYNQLATYTVTARW